MASRIKKICDKLKIGFVFKSCFNKDCRSSPESFNGVGLDEGLKVLQEVRENINVPVVSDFSIPSWAKPTGEVGFDSGASILVQTNLYLKSCCRNKKTYFVEKRTIMSPWNMKNSVRKIEYYGNKKILLYR